MDDGYWRRKVSSQFSLTSREEIQNGIEAAKTALREIEGEGDADSISAALELLGTFQMAAGEDEEGEATLRRAVEALESAADADSAYLNEYNRTRARALMTLGKYADADALLLRTLEVCENLPEPNDGEVAATLDVLGDLYRDQGLPKKSEQMFERAAKMTIRSAGPDHPGTATTLNNLAGSYSQKGDYANAEKLLRRALEISMDAAGGLKPEMAVGLTNLAGICRKQGRRTEAKDLFERAMEVRLTTLGISHPDTVQSMINFGVITYESGDFIAAEPIFRRAVKYARAAWGDSDPRTLDAVEALTTTSAINNTSRQGGGVSVAARRTDRKRARQDRARSRRSRRRK